jgi:very-short-patch-repair endonuclease
MRISGSNKRMRKVLRGTISAARDMRRHPTPAEALLWSHLRGSQLGVRFRRQHPLGRHILDFYCVQARLAVEVDGGVHDSAACVDADRSAALEATGTRVLRVRNAEVLTDIQSVLRTIRSALPGHPPLAP